MTGPRRLRGRLDDDRHGRNERSGPQPIGTHTELEELSVGRVTSRGRSRPGFQAIFAAGGLVVLLAVGFGALGGRRSPSESSGASPSRLASTAPGQAAGQSGAATADECAAPPESAPGVLLEVDDTATAAHVQVLEQPRGVPAPSGPSITQEPGGPRRTRVSAEAPARLRIEGAACANAWIVRIGGDEIDVLGTPGPDAAYASRNRFELFLAPYGGSVADLQADLVFQTMVIRATWPVIVEPYPTPAAFVERGKDRWRAAEGCDVVMDLDGIGVNVRQDCVGSMAVPPGLLPAARAGEQLTFRVADWQLLSATISCGHLGGAEFTVDPEAACADGAPAIDSDGLGPAVARFPAPRADGTWTLAISACAMDQLGSKSICGTWYVNVAVGA